MLGLAREDTRGTFKQPDMWVPTRSPSGLQPQKEETLIEETRNTAVQSQGAEITQKRAEGDTELNVRNKSIAYILENILGNSSTTSQGDGTYEHAITIKTDSPKNPTLSMALSQPGQQDYGFSGYQGSEITLTVETDDLVYASITGQARNMEEQADFTVNFVDDDHYFRHQDVVVEMADTVGSSWSSVGIRDLGLTINNSANLRQDIGALTAKDIVAGLFSITGSFTLDQTGQTYQDLFWDNTPRALRITMNRSNKEIGTGSQNPNIVITLPFITFNDFSPDRSRDEVVTNEMSFTAHYDDSEAKAIEVKVINEDSNLGS